jgi:hypothetical protein
MVCVALEPIGVTGVMEGSPRLQIPNLKFDFVSAVRFSRHFRSL